MSMNKMDWSDNDYSLLSDKEQIEIANTLSNLNNSRNYMETCNGASLDILECEDNYVDDFLYMMNSMLKLKQS